MTTPGSAWEDHPGYRIDLVPLPGIGRVHIGGRLVAESSRGLLVRESDHQDQLYLPVDDVVVPLLPSDHHTRCPFKGEADYWHLERPDGGVEENVVWAYPEPYDEVAGLRDHVAFYADRVAVTAASAYDGGDEGVTRFPVWGTAADLTGLMDVAAIDTGGPDHLRFRAPTYPDPPLGTFFDWARKLRARNVVEGGQLLGAAVVAAAKARPDLRVVDASIVFAKAAHFDSPIDLEVEVRRSGRSMAAFDVRLAQDDELRASALIMSDVGADDLVRHAAPMPDVPGPGDSERLDFGVIGRELRVVDGAYQHQDRVGPPVLHVWSRFAADPGPQRMHQALLAQSSTHWAIAAGLRPHEGITERDAHETVSMGPTAVTMGFHDDVDVTGWLLTETTSIHAGRGSTTAQARTWTADGQLVASSTVQAILRGFVRAPDAMGHDSTTAM